MKYTREHLEGLLDLMPYPIYMYDTDRLHVYMNKRGEDVIGQGMGIPKAREYAMGRYIGEVWPQSWTKGIAKSNTVIFKEKKSISRVISIEMKGSAQWMQMYLGPCLDHQEDVKLIFAIYIRVHNELLVEQVLKPYNTLIKAQGTVRFDAKERELGRQLVCQIIPHILNGGVSGIVFEPDNENSQTDKKNLNQMDLGVYPLECSIREYTVFKNLGAKLIGVYPISVQGEKLCVIAVGYRESSITKENEVLKVCNKLEYYIKTLMLLERLKREVKQKEVYEKRKQIFIDDTEQILCSINSRGEIVEGNRGFTQKLGYSLEGYRGVYFEELMETYDYYGQKEQSIVVDRAGMRCADGSLKWIDWNIVQHVVDGEDVFIAGGKDVTTQKRDEMAYEKAIDILQREKDKSAIYATLSHEFKTPLNIMLASCVMLRKNKSVQRWAIDQIEQLSYTLLKQVTDLIDTAKIKGGFYSLKAQNYNIVEVIEEIISILAEDLSDSGIRFIFDTLEEEIIAKVDRQLLERIVLNLLRLAVQDVGIGQIIVMTKVEEEIVITLQYESTDGTCFETGSSILEAMLGVEDIALKKVETEGMKIYELAMAYDKNLEGYCIGTEEVLQQTQLRCKMEFSDIKN
ncbi:MAG: PAS domain S-box protein [Cellulosilyticaceae bacterium]